MAKADIIQAIVEKANLKKADAERAFEVIISELSNSLKAGEDVRITGFGSFTISERKERDGRNPRTGEKIRIPASKTPVFKPGKELKEAVNGKKKK